MKSEWPVSFLSSSLPLSTVSEDNRWKWRVLWTAMQRTTINIMLRDGSQVQSAVKRPYFYLSVVKSKLQNQSVVNLSLIASQKVLGDVVVIMHHVKEITGAKGKQNWIKNTPPNTFWWISSAVQPWDKQSIASVLSQVEHKCNVSSGNFDGFSTKIWRISLPASATTQYIPLSDNINQTTQKKYWRQLVMLCRRQIKSQMALHWSHYKRHRVKPKSI